MWLTIMSENLDSSGQDGLDSSINLNNLQKFLVILTS